MKYKVKQTISAKTVELIIPGADPSIVQLEELPPELPGKAKKKPKPINEIYTETLRLSISEDLWRRQGWYISPKKQYDFNRMVEMIIEQDMNFYMDIKIGIKADRMYQSFYDFRDRFDMTEDDLSLKSMEKRYQRYRNRLSA